MRLMTALVAAASFAPATATAGRTDCHTHACRVRVCESKSCKQRMGRVARVRAWSALVRPWRGWLESTGACESGSSGGYRLRTTGNGFWYRYQFTPSTWRSVGGLLIRYGVHRGEPMGMHGEMVPAPLEQDVRAVRVRLSQGVGAWPVCG